MNIIDRIHIKLVKFESITGRKPSCIFLGQKEANELIDIIKEQLGCRPFTFSGLEIECLPVFEVDLESYLDAGPIS